MHTYSRPAQDRHRNSEKHLETEKKPHSNQLQVRNQKQQKCSGFGLSESLGSDKHTEELGLSDPTEVKVGF
jgi:hypothetical protein